ncbi:MAG: hypothetical protein AMJ53_07840 [Gammaproteobacteria bacterium SG8_11]|nr:MAG: hypothetical protein AMJ53_07840 [Gammaproteobacteria bacterium SG8_11]
MDSIMSHPAIQSGIIPFIAAFVVIVIFGKTKPVLMGLAAIVAFIAAVFLVTGFSLSPLTSTKKIILIAYIAAILGLGVDLAGEKLNPYRAYVHAIFSLFGVMALVWVIWPVISRERAQNPVSIAAGLSVYVAWIIFGVSTLRQKKAQISAAVFAVAMGTAVVSIIGATALYGQLAAPFAAATGAWLLFFLFAAQKAEFSTSFYITASVTCAMLGAAATVYANLPWLTLALFALVPALAHIPIKQDNAIWLQVLKAYVSALIPVVAAVWYTVQQSADTGYYG